MYLQVWFGFSRVMNFIGGCAAVSALAMLVPKIHQREKQFQLSVAQSPYQAFRKALSSVCSSPVEVTLIELQGLLQTGQVDSALKRMQLDREAVLGIFQLQDFE